MRIALISDTHFGEGRGTEREHDAWEAVDEALRRAQEMGCELVIHAGDLFDTKIPRPEDWSHALRAFATLKVPMVAIHGNHERRGKGLTNPVEGLSKSGLFDYVSSGIKIYELQGGRVAVHGLGWVPETYAKDVLQHWSPKPVEGAFNVLVMHQSIAPFIFNPIEPPSLKLEDMPPGFDLYVDGHVHEHQVTNVHGVPFVIVGSTVTTQVNKAEAENSKGFVVVEIENGRVHSIKKIPLETARRVYYKEFEIDGHSPVEIKKMAEGYLQVLDTKHSKKPLVRIRIKGRLPKGVVPSDVDLRDLRETYADKCILGIGTKLYEETLERKPQLLQEIREQRLSVEEMGFKILRDSLEQQGSAFRFEDIFDHLVDGDAEAALVALLSEQTEKVIERRMEAMGVSA